MMRLPYAAATLRNQVRRARKGHKSLKVVPHGDPDGFGVVRSLEFDRSTSSWLQPILEVIDDNRIVKVERKNKNSKMVVTFAAGPVADVRDEFPLQQVDAILNP